MTSSCTCNLVTKLERLREIIYDISFDLGADWAKLDVKFRGRIMDHVSGSRGLNDRVQEWAEEFDAMWEALPDEDKENYIEKVGDFATDKLEKLCAKIGKQRLTEGRNS